MSSPRKWETVLPADTFECLSWCTSKSVETPDTVVLHVLGHIAPKRKTKNKKLMNMGSDDCYDDLSAQLSQEETTPSSRSIILD